MLDAFWTWLKQQKPVQGTRFEKAVNYALNVYKYLTYLLKHRPNESMNLHLDFAISMRSVKTCM